MIKILAETNDYNYNIDKVVEELLELAEVLVKRRLKEGTPKNPSDESIIEEIGDVKIRLEVLEILFGVDNVNKRVRDKITKYLQYYNEGKYKGRI